MLRFALLCALIAAPVCLSAQVFPKIDRDDVERAIAQAKGAPVIETPPDPVDTPTIDPKKPVGACYKKYLEYRTKFMGTKSPEKSDIEKSVKEMPDGILMFLRGRSYLALGYFKDAADCFARLKQPVGDTSFYNPVQEAIFTEINNGRPWRLRLIAEVWADYKDFETLDKLKEAWAKTQKEAQKIITEFDKYIAAKAFNETIAGIQRRAMQNWLDSAGDNWQRLWNMRRACLERPDDPSTWEALIAYTGPDKQGLNEDCPWYLDARAAMLAMKDCFPDHGRVKSGMIDLDLARNYQLCLQITKALDACKPKAGVDAGVRLLLLNMQTTIEEFRDRWLDDLRMPPG